MSDNENVQTNMTLDDFSNVLKIIDVASQRGVFRGDELSTVGGVRDKVASLVRSIQSVSTQRPNDADDNAESSAENNDVEEVSVTPENATIN